MQSKKFLSKEFKQQSNITLTLKYQSSELPNILAMLKLQLNSQENKLLN